MKALLYSLLLAALMTGCAVYKELKPKPELSPLEQGYIELKKGEKDFKIKQDKKYFIAFPGAQTSHFYLVVKITGKEKLTSFLTPELIDNSTYGKKIQDETFDPQTMSVYAVDNTRPLYYWLIDEVKEDMLLSIQYRYVPQWRFKFENKHAEFKEILKKNHVDRSAYSSLGKTLQPEGFNFKAAMDSVAGHTAGLNTLLKELLAIESIFPKNILNSKDKAYQDYLSLKKDVEDEIAFQKKYALVLDFLNKEFKSRGDALAFLDLVEDFIKYFGEKGTLAANVVELSKSLMNKRLAELLPFYEGRLSGKTDAAPLESDVYKIPAFKRVGDLYKAAGLDVPADFAALSKFVLAFDEKSTKLAEARKTLDGLNAKIKALAKMPEDAFFKEIAEKAEKTLKELPTPFDQEYGKYQSYKCAVSLNRDLGQFQTELAKYLKGFREAEALVPQMNALKAKKEYSGMITLLKPKRYLTFLVDKYKDLDKMSVDEQANGIRGSLKAYTWGKAEKDLAKLHFDRNFINFKKIKPVKDAAVQELEDSLYIMVDRLTRSRVSKFCEEKIGVLENVDSLYEDSVFLPAYDIRFSSGSKRAHLKRKQDLVEHLAKLKENEFPAKAITLLYDQFVKNPADSGVLKARAIVAHGNHYKGKDKELLLKMTECNPLSAKWITKPTKYRRVFVVPITDNRTGKNRYFFRVNIAVPSDAKFPVWDVNIKLPKTVAKPRGKNKAWYEAMTMNKKPLKNEGRFSIIAPTAANKWECQITPLQARKGKNNYLDVYFSHPSFKVFTVSVMVQKPIIKKN